MNFTAPKWFKKGDSWVSDGLVFTAMNDSPEPDVHVSVPSGDYYELVQDSKELRQLRRVLQNLIGK